MKNKKLLAFVLALNSMLSVYSNSAGSKSLTTNYNNMYDKFIKNINTGKSNGENYKLIENILNKRNRELKDLYAQGDYIVKPEYLEWQIFATAFYAERGNGDNTSGNARYNSKTEGYFDENGRYVSTSGGKAYKDKQQPKIIDLGMSIPLKEINREDLNLNLDLAITKPTIPTIQGMANISSLNVPVLELFEFNLLKPELVPVNPATVSILIPSLDAYINDASDTLLGKNTNIGAGTHNLSVGSGRPANAAGNVTQDHAIMEYNRAGSYSSSADSIMNIDVDKRAGITIDGEVGSTVGVTFTSNGTINLKNENTVGLEIQTNGENTVFTIINAGSILGTGEKQVGMLFTVEQFNTPSTHVFINNGTIKLNGANSAGIALPGRAGQSYLHTALNTNKIELNGEKSFGIAVPSNSDLSLGSSVINDVNGEILVNGDKSGGMVAQSNTMNSDVINKGTISVKGEDSFGIYADNMNSEIRNDGSINLSNSKKSIAMRNEGGSLVNNANITIEGGEQNIGMYSSSGGVHNFGNININNGLGNIGVMLKNSGASAINSGDIIIKGEGIKGILLEDSNFVNAGKIEIEGNNAYGAIIKGGLAQLNGTKINITGPNSIGLYAIGKVNVGLVDASATDVTVSNGGINFIAERDGEIILQSSSKFSVGQKTLGFYTKDNGKISIDDAIGTIKGGTTSENRGTAFYLTGKGTGYYPVTTIADIETLLTDSGIEIRNLKLNMESGSRLFSIENVALNLSALKDIDTSGFSNVTIVGNDYIKMLLHKGLLNIDEVVDLDDTASNYSRVEMANTSVINNNIIKGGGNSQQGMAQVNGTGLPKSAVTLTNNGEINLKGQESVGIYANYGIINNNNIIDTQGKKSFGIFGVNGTDIVTAAGSIIKAGDEGAGIVAQSYVLDPVTGTIVNSTYGDGTFKIDHSGEVIMSAGSNSFGIYADNNDTNVLTNTATRIVNLNVGSMIDMSGTTKGTALFAKKSTVNTVGDMKIGTDGIGIYAKDSNVNLTGGTMDILGSGSTGIFLDGTSNLAATSGVINVKADNTTVFFINSLATTTTGIENIQINVDPNLKMTLANVKNTNFKYDGTLNGAGKGSVLIAGENSAIMLDTNGNMGSTYENVVGLATKGGSAVNRGNLNLTGINSIGLYTENANAVNEGNVILGANGVGVYNENGTVINISGKIETGTNGIGIFGADSTSMTNNTLITSAGDSAIGIYSEGDITGTTIKNDISGLIDLSGSNTLGIYTTGTQAKNVINDGEIKIGDSLEINKPSIGIYNNILGSTIQNNGTVTLGKGSLGIYDKGGQVTENGILNIGEKGTGILSENGSVNITSNSVMNIAGNETVGVYGKNNTSITNASSNITLGNGSYGFVLETGSNLTNIGSVTLGDNSVLVYGKGAGTITSSNTASIIATGSDNIMFYTIDGGRVENKSSITADTGTGNIGIYNKGGSIENEGNISLGDSVLVYNGGTVDPNSSKYSVGVYGEKSAVVNKGDISLGADAVGVYVKDNTVIAKNYGKITAGSLSSPKAGAIGIFADGGVGIENFGDITLFGEKSIGIAGRNAGSIINHGTLSITGADSIGIYGTLNTTVENKGTINISGADSVGIVAPSGKLINEGIIHYTNGASASSEQAGYPLPELINMGLIKVDGHFSNEGMDISLKPNLDTLVSSTIPGVDFIMNSGSISANSMTITDTVKVLPDFSQGTNANVYKLENVFMTSTGQVTSSNGKIPVVSKSLTWEATPKVNDEGNVDIYMQKLAYENFTDGLWYEDFGKALDEKYAGSTGEAGSIFDKIDLIEEESDFRHVMASLAGNVYANMNQRQDDISRAFDSSLSLMENSKNNTKENVKVNIIAGRGRTKEDTDGVVGYDYTTTGVLALREVERTYRHTFGYSLGYLHTGFEFKDGNDSEEWADTSQLGLHSKYDINDWVLKNNITGRVSIHNIDRNIDWPSPTGRSELNGTYETYSISSDNRLGKELSLGKNGSITPYGGIKATYITRPTFSEKGLESLEVEGNDAWSVKPRAGIELKGSMPLGATTAWQLKGALDVSYEYELANLNERESARLTKIEDNYHNLSKPEKEKGTLRTRAELGVEIEDRYGIFLTGEYGVGNSDRDDYRAGVTLKAVF